jgi:hypothetical protein
MNVPFKISQSLIKEVRKNDHCPKQIYYSFVEGKDLIEPSAVMLKGRYFESELIGACRGGLKEPAQYTKVNLKPNKSASKAAKVKFLTDRGHQTEGLTVKELDEKLKFEPAEYVNGDKLQSYKDLDNIVDFARHVCTVLNIDLDAGESQADLQSETLKGAIDHINKDLQSEGLANYDVKYTDTKEDDRWNGWGNPEDKEDSHIQAIHYTLLSHELFGEWRPFYFLVFGKDKWAKILRFKITQSSLDAHKERIAYTAEKIREYALTDYKGNGSFNKCMSCPFRSICDDVNDIPEIEVIEI